MNRLLFCFFLLVGFQSIHAQPSIISGPMPGYTTMSEVGVWLQVNEPAEVVLAYWTEESKKTYLKPSFEDQENSGVVKFVITNLEPGIEYDYEVLLDDQVMDFEDALTFKTQALWQYRTDPPTTRVALGSCAYINEEAYDRPGKPYGSHYEIFDAIADKEPDAMLWLGDNIYLREYDYFSKSGYIHRYSHTRQTPELQRLLRSTHHYAIWDDHDFGPNDAMGSSWPHKDWAVESFDLFWMNPSVGLPDLEGITSAFMMNDIAFFLLDNRYHRTSDDIKSQTPTMLGKDQIDWLIEAMKYSRAPYKMVACGSQILNPDAIFENYANFEEERSYLLNRIAEEKINGVVFLTGDRHHTELRKETIGGTTMYDLTVSPLTSGVHSGENESSENRVKNTHVSKHNFGIIEFTGERLAREMKIYIFDHNGDEIWSQSITP